MVAYTNSQQLPYQTATDPRCEAASDVARQFKGVWQRFVERFETRAVPLINLSNRVANPPTAMVRRFAPADAAEDVSPIAFDTVVVDNDGMVNLDADPYAITPRRPGIYLAYGHIRLSNFASPSDLECTISGGFAGNGTIHGFSDDAPGYVEIFAADVPNSSLTDLTAYTQVYWNPDEIGANSLSPVQLSKFGTTAVRLEFASLAVAWLADVRS